MRPSAAVMPDVFGEYGVQMPLAHDQQRPVSSALMVGRLEDMHGKRRLLLVGLAVMVAGSALHGIGEVAQLHGGLSGGVVHRVPAGTART